MKKLIAIIAILSMFITTGIAFAQEDYALQVVFESDPKSTEIQNETFLLVELGDEISFTRKVVSIGMDTYTSEWNFDPEILDCASTPEIDGSDLECTVIGGGVSDVSYTVTAIMDDESQRTAESKIISVSVGDYVPEFMDYVGHPNQTAIEYLYENGIVAGYPDGTFMADITLTRAELMKILVLGAGYNPMIADYKNCFPDVNDEWFSRYVCFALENEWVEGYPDGEFKPGKYVLKIEAMKMLLEVFDVEVVDSMEAPYEDIHPDAWFSDYIMTAKNMGLLEEDGNLYWPGIGIDRGQISENLYRLLMQL